MTAPTSRRNCGGPWSGVAGADINMAVDPVDLDKESEVLEELARAHARQTEGAEVPFDGAEWLARARELTAYNPDYFGCLPPKGPPCGLCLDGKRGGDS